MASVDAVLLPSLKAVTPNDSTNLPDGVASAVYVGVSGDLKVTTAAGDVVILVSLAAGVFHPVPVARVWSTGTTATSVVAGYI